MKGILGIPVRMFCLCLEAFYMTGQQIYGYNEKISLVTVHWGQRYSYGKKLFESG